MTALAGELRRLLSRRMIKVLVDLAAVGIAVGAVITFFNTAQTSDASLRQRTADAGARVARCRVNPNGSGPSVPSGPKGPSFESREKFCRFRVGEVTDDRFKLSNLKGVLQGVTAPLVIVAWVIGASSIGAEWQARSISTLLTWEPRRARVLVANVMAAIIVAGGVQPRELGVVVGRPLARGPGARHHGRAPAAAGCGRLAASCCGAS